MDNEQHAPALASRHYILVTSDFSGFGFALEKVSRHEEKHIDHVMIAVKPDGSTLRDLQEEKDKVPMYKNTGKGLIEVIPLIQVMQDRKKYKDSYWIWDGNHNEAENTLLRKEGYKVFGGLAFAQKMEKERDFTIRLMKTLGLATPEHKEFKNIIEGIKYLQSYPDRSYVYKPNDQDASLTVVPDNEVPQEANIEMQELIQSLGINDFVLQEKIYEGVEVNVEFFVQNGIPLLAQANLESKRRSNGDLGKPLGCAMDCCWIIDMNSQLAKMTLDHLRPLLTKLKYTGFADLNVIISQTGANFLETCFRCGYNAHPNFFTTISRQEFFSTCADLVDGKYGTKPYEGGGTTRKGFGASITLRTDAPHKGLPIQFPDAIRKNVYIFDAMKNKEGLAQTGWSEDIAIITAFGYTIEKAFEFCYKNCEKVRFIGKDYRTDAISLDYPTSIINRYRALECMGLL